MDENAIQMSRMMRDLRHLFWALLVLPVVSLTACGTFTVRIEQPGEPTVAASGPFQETATPETRQPTEIEAVGWYGSIHSVSGAEPDNDFFKPWHLSLWPKFGRAVGVAGADPALNAEIDRLRDRDTKAVLWGSLTCGVSDYGTCQLMVTRLSADDGGPMVSPEPVTGWEGTVGFLPQQPGSQNDLLYFVLTGKIPILYGIASPDATIQAELEQLAGTNQEIYIWGTLQPKAQPTTGTRIDVTRLEIIGQNESEMP